MRPSSILSSFLRLSKTCPPVHPNAALIGIHCLHLQKPPVGLSLIPPFPLENTFTSRGNRLSSIGITQTAVWAGIFIRFPTHLLFLPMVHGILFITDPTQISATNFDARNAGKIEGHHLHMHTNFSSSQNDFHGKMILFPPLKETRMRS